MIALTDADDPRFVALANRLLEAAVTTYRPAEIYLVRIDQWFDTKWLNFSGKALGALGVWNKRTTVPPFHPGRVREEHHFSVTTNPDAFEKTPAAPLHLAQESSQNLVRSISRISSDAVFFWYSSATVGLDRGSIMLYRTHQNEVLSRYVSFQRTATWRLDRHLGISPGEVRHLLQCDQSCLQSLAPKCR